MADETPGRVAATLAEIREHAGRCWCGAIHPAGWRHASGAGTAYPGGPPTKEE